MHSISTRIVSLTFGAILLLIPSSFAYDSSLSSEAVSDAYFLGQRSDQKLARFFADYTHHLPFPKTGPYISEIQLLTPYAQVVDLSRQNTTGYSSQQAWQDYQDRGDTIRVRIRIEFTPTYTAVASQKKSGNPTGGAQFTPRPLDFWRDKSYDYVLRQDDKSIDPVSVDGQPIYDPYGTFLGAYVWLTYSADDVSSSGTDVEVFAPGNQHVVTTFDLSNLR